MYSFRSIILSYIITDVVAGVGLVTLDRPAALNALNLNMIRDLTKTLNDWRDDPAIEAVAVRGSNKNGPFGGFCAGGDIRFFHAAGMSDDPDLEAFFTEEYQLNYLIFNYPKPYIAFMDGIVMGGGMGISQGATLRVITERTKMAMPETNIGLFPDVGGGYFLSRCPGSSGEYLALTGKLLVGADALDVDLADGLADSDDMADLWDGLTNNPMMSVTTRIGRLQSRLKRGTSSDWLTPEINSIFCLDSVKDIVQALTKSGSQWAADTLAVLQKRSPLMLHVTFKQLRLGRSMTLADDLRMERTLVRHCFQTDHLQRSGTTSETIEGIRALAIDKDHSPAWDPAGIEEVTSAMVDPFFKSPWAAEHHPLKDLV